MPARATSQAKALPPANSHTWRPRRFFRPFGPRRLGSSEVAAVALCSARDRVSPALRQPSSTYRGLIPSTKTSPSRSASVRTDLKPPPEAPASGRTAGPSGRAASIAADATASAAADHQHATPRPAECAAPRAPLPLAIVRPHRAEEAVRVVDHDEIESRPRAGMWLGGAVSTSTSTPASAAPLLRACGRRLVGDDRHGAPREADLRGNRRRAVRRARTRSARSAHPASRRSCRRRAGGIAPRRKDSTSACGA